MNVNAVIERGGGPLIPAIRAGIDVVKISRLQQRLDRWPALADRLFTERERRYSFSKPHPIQHLGARFAAKEATFKALGCGWPSIAWHDVETASEGGPPVLRLRGNAALTAGRCVALLSLSHDGNYAVAQVILWDPGSATRASEDI